MAVHSRKASSLCLCSIALLARIIILTVPNPIYVIKTRMQLQKSTCMLTVRHLWCGDRLCSHYRGLSSSLAGALESAMCRTLCDLMKKPAAMSFKLNQLYTVHCIDMYLAAVCSLVTSLWYYPHEVIRTRSRDNNSPSQQKYHSFCQTLFKVLNLEGECGLYAEMTAQLITVVLNSTEKEPMAPTRWPIMQITRSIWPKCEGSHGRCLRPNGVYTVYQFYHSTRRTLENHAVLAGGFHRQCVGTRITLLKQRRCYPLFLVGKLISICVSTNGKWIRPF